MRQVVASPVTGKHMCKKSNVGNARIATHFISEINEWDDHGFSPVATPVALINGTEDKARF